MHQTMQWHGVSHKCSRPQDKLDYVVLSAHGSTRAKCRRSNGMTQIRSNTKDTRTGVPAPMHTRNTCDFDWVDRIRARLRKTCSRDKNVTLCFTPPEIGSTTCNYVAMSTFIVDSVLRLHAYPLLWGSMYLYFVQFLHLLCWILFVFFPWILCSSPVSIHELTRLYTV